MYKKVTTRLFGAGKTLEEFNGSSCTDLGGQVETIDAYDNWSSATPESSPKEGATHFAH